MNMVLLDPDKSVQVEDRDEKGFHLVSSLLIFAVQDRLMSLLFLKRAVVFSSTSFASRAVSPC